MTQEINPLNKYKAEDQKKSLLYAMIGNLVLGFILLLPSFSEWATNYNAQLCIATACFFLLLVQFYDWKNNWLNLLLALTYLALLYFEYKVLGFPGTAVEIDTDRYQISKGVFMDMFLWILPGVYIGLRFCLGIPLLLMAKWKK